jgi:3-carboxy-cis,cis-muconate cycloisomerase
MSLFGSNGFAAQFADARIAGLFADESWLQALVRVEVALARAQAGCGLIPTGTADVIEARAASFAPDAAALAAASLEDGFPIIGLVDQLRQHVGEDAARQVHFGATTQDIMDTAMVLQVRTALGLLRPQLHQTCQALATMAERERQTLCVGRTHLQPALPVTFGLKAARWLAPLLRHDRRLNEIAPRLEVVQLGGAAGTLASHGAQGPAVQAALAGLLGLGVAPAPWHAERDGVLELAGWLSLVTGSLAKIGQDILLLSQPEVGEVRISGGPSGGSSAMPHKSNPLLAERLLVAARTNAALLGLLHQTVAHEHERGTHGWQLELLHLPTMLALTGGALGAAETLIQHLRVDAARMQANLAATRGLLLSEAASLALTPQVGAAEAKRLVRAASVAAQAGPGHLIDHLRSRTTAAVDWERLRDESHYLGATAVFIDRVLAEARYSLPTP